MKLRYIIALVAPFLGLTLAISIPMLREQGLLVFWQRLSTPPSHVQTIVSASFSFITIIGSDGHLYTCDTSRFCEWHVVQPVAKRVPANDTSYPCEADFIAFRWLNLPFFRIDTCLQGQETHPDAFTRYAYVLDRNGKIWHWSKTFGPDYGSTITSTLMLPVLGLCVGSFITLSMLIYEFAVHRKLQ